MKPESQHLDFLVSQYVDGCLDGANKKSVEQQLLTDPVARKLYDDHREVQDFLDDWGNRIPLINWDQFDQDLAARLATESVGASHYSLFRRWARPVAAAAALFIAASIGYNWHAWWGPHQNVAQGQHPIAVVEPVKLVTIPGMQRATQPSNTNVTIDAPDAQPLAVRTANTARFATINAPVDSAAKEALLESFAAGIGDVTDSQRHLQPVPQGSVSASTVPEIQEKPEVIYP